MMKKLQLGFDFVNTEDLAKRQVEHINKTQNAYRRKKYPSHYTEWTSTNGKEHAFIVWYHY